MEGARKLQARLGAQLGADRGARDDLLAGLREYMAQPNQVRAPWSLCYSQMLCHVSSVARRLSLYVGPPPSASLPLPVGGHGKQTSPPNLLACMYPKMHLL